MTSVESHGCCGITCALTAVGAVAAVYLVARFVQFLSLQFASPNLKQKYAKAGTWAVVTGASEGIGQALALDFAKRGFNVCVIARSKDKLASVVEEIEKKKVQGKAISFDFSTASSHDYKKLFNELDAIELAVLVNNVGVNYTYANYFDEVDIEEDLRILKVNCEAQLQMTKYAVRRLRPKKSGAIISLSSFTATTPSPLLSTYTATKSFNYGFSNSLAFELQGTGIDVLTVTPNLVISRMTSGVSTKAPKPSFLKVSASAMARQTLNALGTTKVTSGHRNHAIIEGVLSFLPVDFVGNQILKMHKDIKKRAERKLQQGK
ncbi:short chain dehydrogenase, putative [Bodo saltans]|uniref:Short chain dehydrogenase, putative n=1 Tax=Bodo saltans TaxID=75058 RepID=A0A0S4IWL0_BODSA|nr:short chain dehydrogenase, putative [Bodo saltans]|eukprot:CUF35464.1 short chain dehydrogenase, putative [Bodo saltans]